MTTRKKTIFLSISFLLFLFSFVVLLILPHFKKIKEISKEISQVRLQLKKNEERKKEIEKFKSLLPQIQQDFAKFESSFVYKEIPIDFVEFLEKMAKDLQIQSQTSILTSSKDIFSFHIKGIGFPENVFRFIERIENCNYLTQIEKLNIKKVTEVELKKEETERFSSNDLKFEISFSVLTK